MKILTIQCDKCGNICKGDFFTVYRETLNVSDSCIRGKSHICEHCYGIMLKALYEKLEIKPLPVTDVNKLREAIMNQHYDDSFQSLIDQAIKTSLEMENKDNETN